MTSKNFEGQTGNILGKVVFFDYSRTTTKTASESAREANLRRFQDARAHVIGRVVKVGVSQKGSHYFLVANSNIRDAETGEAQIRSYKPEGVSNFRIGTVPTTEAVEALIEADLAPETTEEAPVADTTEQAFEKALSFPAPIDQDRIAADVAAGRRVVAHEAFSLELAPAHLVEAHKALVNAANAVLEARDRDEAMDEADYLGQNHAVAPTAEEAREEVAALDEKIASGAEVTAEEIDRGVEAIRISQAHLNRVPSVDELEARNRAADAEMAYEIAANFGPEQTVVNVLTGETVREGQKTKPKTRKSGNGYERPAKIAPAMVPAEIMRAIRAFEKTIAPLKEFGAFDSDPMAVLHVLIGQKLGLKSGEIKATSASDWELYTDKKGVGQAAKTLRKAAGQLVRDLKYIRSKAGRHSASTFENTIEAECWRARFDLSW